MPARSAPLPAGKPLTRSSALRRAAIVRTTQLARTVRPPRRKTTEGEFSAKVRTVLWMRFGGLCAVCGEPLPVTGWTAQHRRARQMGGSADPITVTAANGIAVHEVPCHRPRIEGNPTTAKRAGWRVPQGTDPATWPLRLWTGERVLLNTGGTYGPAEPNEEN